MSRGASHGAGMALRGGMSQGTTTGAAVASARVLVVDDDANLRRLVRDNLTLEGMEVQAVGDVPAAREALRAATPDLIVLDVMLPGESGFDLCRELSADGATHDVPVLFLSARTELEDKITGLGLGAVDYLAKPFDPAELVARSHAVLRARRRARASAQRELDRFKDEVLALVGHELRTPLTLVLGYAELLRARGDSFSPERLNGFLQEITSGSTRLARLLEDVLLLVTPPPQFGLVDLREPIAQAVGTVRPRIQAQGLALDYQPAAGPLRVMGAPLALAAAARHLLENAATFSPRGGRVAAALAAAGSEARFTVTDTGPGIPPEEQERIFDRFHQVSQGLSRTHGGLGIGLSIVRLVATQHRGDVVVDSTPGVGSRFTLSLPLVAAPAAGAPESG